MDISSLKVVADDIENGAWIDEIPEMDDLRLKVRGYSAKAYGEYLQKRLKLLPRSAKARDGSYLPAYIKPLADEAMLDVILLDWQNLKSDGNEVPYSREIAEQFVKNPDLRAFRQAIEWAANAVGKPAGDELADATDVSVGA